MIPALVFFLCGFNAVISQTVLLRELLVVFQGNELTLGLLLSQWLLGVALGSWFATRPAWQDRVGLLPPIAGGALWFPAAVVAVRLLRGWLAALPGQGFGLGLAWLAAGAVMLPLAFLVGVQFSAGVRWLESRQTAAAGSKVYVWEALGYLAGGVLYTFLLASWLGSVAISGLAAVSAAAGATLAARRSRTRWLAAGLALLLAAMTLIWARPLETWSLDRQYRGWTLRTVQNSPYGQLAAADRAGERTFFFQGQPGLTLPYPDSDQTDIFTGLPWLCQPASRRVLLLGGGGSYLSALLAHPLDRLVYVELDPWFLRLLDQYWLAGLANPFRDPRLEVRSEDGRRYAAATKERFDLVFAAVPYPLTLAQNRYFTREFFQEIRGVLTQDGWLALALPGSLVFLDPDWAELLKIVRSTLQDVFPNVWVLPGETTLLLAWTSREWPTPDQLQARLLASPVRYRALSPAYLAYRLDSEKQAWLEEQLARAESSARLNQDYFPSALVAGLQHWQSMFSPAAARVYHRLRRHLWLVWPLLLFWLLLGRASVRATAAASGCAAMGLQMLSWWSLQAASGVLYGWLGLVSGLFMAGMALAALMAQAGLRRWQPLTALLCSEGLFLAWILGWWLMVRLGPLPLPACLLFSAGSGWLLGSQFPSLTALAGQAGGVYSADTIGGWLAAMGIGTLLIPLWGWELTLLALAALKLATFKTWILAGVELRLRGGPEASQ